MPWPEKVAAFLAGPRIARLAVTKPDGAPHVTPVWMKAEGEHIYFIMQSKTAKARSLAKRPAAAVAVDVARPAYQGVMLEGRMEPCDERAQELLEWMAVKYLGEEPGRAYIRQRSQTDVASDRQAYRLVPTRISYIGQFKNLPAGEG